MTRDEAIDNGIRLLDEKFGPGWVDKIDLDTFNIVDGCHCILGQVYSHMADEVHVTEFGSATHYSGFGYAITEFNIEPCEYGFSWPLNFGDRWLQRGWREKIRALRVSRELDVVKEVSYA